MQAEPEFRFDMGDSFAMYGQPLSCPPSATSFSSASSAYEPYTPTSRRSTPNQIFEFDGGCVPFGGAHNGDLTSPVGQMTRFMFAPSVKAEPDQFGFQSNPATPIKKMDGMATPDYDHILEMSTTSRQSVGSITPSGSFPFYTISPPPSAMGSTSFMMTPTQSLSGSEGAESSSWCSNDSPIPFFPSKGLGTFVDMEGLDMDRHSESPVTFHLQAPGSPSRVRAHRKMMVNEVQRKTHELQRVQIRTSRKSPGSKSDAAPVDVVRRAMCKCDYPGCHKAFRRNEHLKRHKQTFHGEGPNRFSCEFCGKDQFNRQDNLNNHRKLHARPNSRNRGVEYIQAAVSIIEQEERSRKRRAPPKSKTEKRDDEY